MKLQIDTTAKTIKLDESVKMDELIKELNRMFPLELWKEFQLITNVTINWQPNPIIIKEYPVWPTYPTWPYLTQPYPFYPWITCGTSSYELNPGCYDIQI